MRNRLETTAYATLAMMLALTSCKRQPAQYEPAVPMLAAPMMARTVATGVNDADRRIAYSHTFNVDLPSADVQRVQQKNMADCLAAGCTILSTRLDRLRDGAVQAAISVRIAPDRYQSFADNVIAPPARLISHTETAEDKTIPLLDITKRLVAQQALRDRLSQLLNQAGTSVADLVAVEKQLADVQGAIESETAQRDYLNTITDTVKVDVVYNGLIQQAGSFDLSPVRAALDGFGHTVIVSLGEMIDWIAQALPWLPLAVLVGWMVRRWIRRRLP